MVGVDFNLIASNVVMLKALVFTCNGWIDGWINGLRPLNIVLHCHHSNPLVEMSSAQWFSGRASSLRLVGCEFDPWPGHPKVCHNGTNGLPAWHSMLGVGSSNDSQDCCCPLLSLKCRGKVLHPLGRV